MPASKTFRKNKRTPIYFDGEILCWVTSPETVTAWVEFPSEDEGTNPHPIVGEASCDMEPPIAKVVDECKGRNVG